MRELVCARSVTGRIFTAHEGAEQHCQVGNSALVREEIVRWLARFHAGIALPESKQPAPDRRTPWTRIKVTVPVGTLRVESKIGNPLGGVMQLIRKAVNRIWPALFLLANLLSFAYPNPAVALEEVIVSYAGPTVTFLPAEVARQRGFMREQNLDVKLLLTRSEVDRAALVSGSVDYTLRAGSSFVSAARGLPVRIVLVGTMRPFWGLVVRPEVKSVTELKGKSMGVPGFLGSQHVSAKFILKHYGLDPDKDIVYRIVDSGTRIAGMSSGAIDCSMMDYGEAFRAKNAGFKFLVNAADLHGLLAGGLAVNTKKLKEQPDQVRRMLKAMVQALKYIQDDPEGTQQVMMSWLKIDREMAADIYQMARNNYTKNGMVDEPTLNSLVTTMLAEAGIKGVNVSQLTDFSLLQQALK
jgi:ABC-type nitrate/sulfonate/bicarbonate transport system substrate-binding protein